MGAHKELRKRLLKKVEPQTLSLDDLRKSEWSERFEKLMRNRMVMGAFRYGRIGEPGKPTFDRVAYIRVKLDRYETTGNLEALVDVANLALLEFVESAHVNKHFSSLDDTDEHAKEKRLK